MQVCTSLQTDNHASCSQLPTTQFLQAGCLSCSPTNSAKALKARAENKSYLIKSVDVLLPVKKFVRPVFHLQLLRASLK